LSARKGKVAGRKKGASVSRLRREAVVKGVPKKKRVNGVISISFGWINDAGFKFFLRPGLNIKLLEKKLQNLQRQTAPQSKYQETSSNLGGKVAKPSNAPALKEKGEDVVLK